MADLTDKTLVAVQVVVLTDAGVRTEEVMNTVVSLGELTAGIPAKLLLANLRGCANGQT